MVDPLAVLLFLLGWVLLRFVLELVVHEVDCAALVWLVLHDAADRLEKVIRVLVLASERMVVDADARVEDAADLSLGDGVSFNEGNTWLVIKDNIFLLADAGFELLSVDLEDTLAADVQLSDCQRIAGVRYG